MGASSTTRRWWRTLDLDRFDGIVLGVALALIVAIGGVVLAGDRVGVYVAGDGYGPTGIVRGAEPIRVRFSDAMDARSVEARFRIEPDVPGTFSWPDAHTLRFTPDDPLPGGETVRVTVAAGAESARHGAQLHDALTWTFTVRLPRVVYLAPADRYARDLTLTDLQTSEVRTLTATPDGVEEFAISRDGAQIAYTRINPNGTSDIWLLDVRGGTERPITNCVEALCSHPAWNPDGTQIAYQREDRLTPQGGEGLGPPRAWVVDVTTLETQLLFSDAQVLGAAPVWSPDGRRLAVADATLPGIRVYDYATQRTTTIESLESVNGQFSPDGTRLVYPVLVRGALGPQSYRHLAMADFETDSLTRLSGPEDTPVEDIAGMWSPDGTRLVIARRYLDERFTTGTQLYLLDVASGAVTPLVVDGLYNHAAVRWDPSGRRVVFQRFPLTEANGLPSVWMVDVASGELTQIAARAVMPAWLP